MLFSPRCLYKVCPFWNHGSSSSAATKPSLRPPGHRPSQFASFSVTYCLQHSLTLWHPGPTCTVWWLCLWVIASWWVCEAPQYVTSVIYSEGSSWSDRRLQAGESRRPTPVATGAWPLLPPGSTSRPNMGPGRPLLISLSSKEVINSDRVCVCVLQTPRI